MGNFYPQVIAYVHFPKKIKHDPRALLKKYGIEFQTLSLAVITMMMTFKSPIKECRFELSFTWSQTHPEMQISGVWNFNFLLSSPGSQSGAQQKWM